MLIRIDVEELLLSNGIILHKGDVVRTEEHPGLDTALAAGIAEAADEKPAPKSPAERMRRK